jgi:hypothetical protein
MKHFLSILFTIALGIYTAVAAETTPPEVPHLPQTNRLPGVDLAEGISQIAGTAISPLLGVSSVGAWRYYKTPESKRESLPWFCHPGFWGFGFTILALCFLKDVLGTIAPPLVKKPLDMAELFESKVSALVASVAFVPFVVAKMSQDFQTTQALAPQPVDFQCASLIPLALLDFDFRLLFVPLGIVAFLVVWMTGHAINVLIALCPFGFIDTLLKIFKMSILGLVVFSYLISPYLGGVISLLIVIAAAMLAPMAFRLTVFGTLFAGDTLMPWRARRSTTPTEAHAFIARRWSGVPTRTYGRITRSDDGTVCFSYRPWLVFPRRSVPFPQGRLSISKGVYYPSLFHRAGAENSPTRVILFPPRYRNYEQTIAEHFQISEIRDSTLHKGYKAAKAWLADLLNFGKTKYAD